MDFKHNDLMRGYLKSDNPKITALKSKQFHDQFTPVPTLTLDLVNARDTGDPKMATDNLVVGWIVMPFTQK